MIDHSDRRGGLRGNRGFRGFFASEVAANAGYTLYGIAIVWISYRLTGNVAVAGAALGIEFGVYALSFLVGPVVDRRPSPRRIALVGYALQAVLAALLGALVGSPLLGVPLLLALVAVLSVIWDFTWTATSAMLPRLVGRDQLFLASGLTQAASGVPQVVGAAAGAVLLGVGSPPAALYLYALLNLAALAALVPVRLTTAPPAEGGFVEELARGWRFLAGGAGRPLLQLASFAALQGVVSAAPAILFAVVAERGYPQPAVVYGTLATAFALGGVAGSLLLGLLAPRRRLGAFLLGLVALESALFAAAAGTASSLPLSLAVWFAVGAVEGAFFNALLVYLQGTTPPTVLARTFTNTYLFRGSGRASGAVVVGLLAGGVAFASLSLGLAAALAVLAAGGAAALPAVRSLSF